MAAQAGDLDAAWRAMSGVEGELTLDPEVAAAWLALLRNSPNRESAAAEAAKVVERWPDDPSLVTRACDVLIRVAEARPADEPLPSEPPAAFAAAAAARCRASLPDAGDDGLLIAHLQMAEANALRLLRKHDAALAAARAALERVPEQAGFWFNLGLIHKARLDLGEALAAFTRARELSGSTKPILWNLAICATGAGQGALAVSAMRALGHDARASETGMPFVEGLPPMQVRVATVGTGHGGSELPDRSVGFELLWVTPLSPCHGVLSSASHRASSVDFGDVVLWDAVPVGMTEIEGRPVLRFPLLAVLARGRERRFRFVALERERGALESFARALPHDCQLFVHAERLETVCARCASGEPAHAHEHARVPASAERLAYGKLVLGEQVDLARVRQELEQRMRQSAGLQVVVPELFEALGDTVAAGKAHQLWRGLEKQAVRAAH